jgi:hypothetical protein
VSRSELEALKRFPDYEGLSDGTLMRIEGNKEFRIYCHDVEGVPFGVITQGFCSMLSEVYDEILQREANHASGLDQHRSLSPLRGGASRCN